MTGILDTHSFLWAAIAPEKLSAKVRLLVADKNNEIFVSTITFWEISLKVSLGKLELTGCEPQDLVEISRQMALTICAPSAEESARFCRLPKVAHNPFDRMLIWQCLENRWTFITKDRYLDPYRAIGLQTAW